MSDLQWFKNTETGFVEAARKGSPTYRNMRTQMVGGDDDPHLLWEPCEAPKVEKPTKYRSGMQPTHQVDRRRGQVLHGQGPDGEKPGQQLDSGPTPPPADAPKGDE